LLGEYEASGIRPRFLTRLDYYGLGAAFMEAMTTERKQNGG
jgi:hypothetical protein